MNIHLHVDIPDPSLASETPSSESDRMSLVIDTQQLWLSHMVCVSVMMRTPETNADPALGQGQGSSLSTMPPQHAALVLTLTLKGGIIFE